jgi:predicted PurR-regulated permease PerM
VTPQTKRTLIRLGAGLGFFFVLLLLIQAFSTVTTLLLTAFFLAYILNPAVIQLTRLGIGRSLASLVILMGGLLLVFSLILFLVPATLKEIASFARLLPEYIATLQAKFLIIAEQLNINIPSDWDEIFAMIATRWRQILARTADPAARFLSSVVFSTFHLISFLFYALLIPVITYYLLVSFENVTTGVKELIPPYLRVPVLEKLRQIDMVLAGFIRGQLTICLVLAFLYSLGFLLIGIDLALLLGIVSGLLFIVPYLGTLIGVIAGSLMAFAKFGDLIHVIYVLAWIGAVQLLESYILTPRIVGHAIGLHPVVYILALIAAGNLFGFVGMLVAIPVTAVLKVLLVTAIDAYKASYLYEEPLETSARNH